MPAHCRAKNNSDTYTMQITLYNWNSEQTYQDQGRWKGRGWGAYSPHFFENYKELLRKSAFSSHPALRVTDQAPLTTFKVAPRPLKTNALSACHTLQHFFTRSHARKAKQQTERLTAHVQPVSLRFFKLCKIQIFKSNRFAE